MFSIHFGIPEMYDFWIELSNSVKSGKCSKKDKLLYDKIVKALNHLSDNPHYNSLNSHEINALSKRYGIKIWESYLENNTPAAGRLFWAYGPNKGDITIVAIEPHPNDKKNSYNKIKLSGLS